MYILIRYAAINFLGGLSPVKLGIGSATALFGRRRQAPLGTYARNTCSNIRMIVVEASCNASVCVVIVLLSVLSLQILVK